MMNMMFSYWEIHKTPYDISFCELDDLGHSRTSSFSGQFAREQGQYMLILQLVTVHMAICHDEYDVFLPGNPQDAI